MNYSDAIPIAVENTNSKPRIRMLKNQHILPVDIAKNGSVVIYELGEKQFQVHLTSDKEFFDKTKIDGNINRIKQSADFNPCATSPNRKKSTTGSGSKREFNFNIKNYETPNPNNNNELSHKETDESKKKSLLHQKETLDLLPSGKALSENEGYYLEGKEIDKNCDHEINKHGINFDDNRGNYITDIAKQPGVDSNQVKINENENKTFFNEMSRFRNIGESENINLKSKAGIRCRGRMLFIKKAIVGSIEDIEKKEKDTTRNLIGSNVDNNQQDFDEEESAMAYGICFICDRFIQSSNLSHADGCHHSFCKKCGKAFYEDKIEQGEFSFKCPVFTCPQKVRKSTVIKALVSEKHFNVTEGEEGKLKRSIMETIAQKKKNQQKIENVKYYTNKHVIDVNSNETFFMFNKAKDQFCNKCSEPALFGKSGNHFVKCLSCYHSMCKYCMKSYTPSHLDMSSSSYCRIFFRRNVVPKREGEKKCCREYCMAVLLVLVSYLALCMTAYKYIALLITRSLRMKKYSSCVKRALYNMIVAVLCIVVTPLLLISIPYFPVILSLMPR